MYIVFWPNVLQESIINTSIDLKHNFTPKKSYLQSLALHKECAYVKIIQDLSKITVNIAY